MSTLPARLGKLLGQVLAGVAEGIKPQASASSSDKGRKYKVSVRPSEGLPVHGDIAAREVDATSPEQAAERRICAIASELHAMGAPCNGTYEAHVEGVKTYRVSAMLMHKVEIVP